MRQFPISETITADGATMKLDNQKNGCKELCVFEEHNRYEEFSLVWAMGRRCISIRNQTRNRKTFLSDFWVDGKRKYVTAKNISSALNFAAGALNYPSLKGIPIKRVENNSLFAVNSNAFSLSGYIHRDIQKMDRWRGETFK